MRIRRRRSILWWGKWSGAAVCVLVFGIGVASTQWYASWFDATGHTGISVAGGRLIVNWYDGSKPSPLLSRGWRFGTNDRPLEWLIVWGRVGGFPGNPTFVSLPLWIPLVVFTAAAALLWWLGRHRPTSGHCQCCDYDLTGNVSGRCPECGATVWG